jgi:predicted RNA-binding Zn-ribbon protein involved in translation (DUF1610 family)/preprotein translocase subunit YajC
MQHESAKSKAQAAEDKPQREPMRGSTSSIRRNPSTDQKKVRRSMTKKAERGSCVGCGTPMVVPKNTRSPKCPTCVDGDRQEAYENSQDSPFDQYASAPSPARKTYDPDEVFDQKRSARTGPNQNTHDWRPSLDYCPACGMDKPEDKDDWVPTCDTVNDDLHEKQSSLSAEATQFETRADRLNPGDSIRTPTGQTLKVKKVRNHESSGRHVYIETDQGTHLEDRTRQFQVVPDNQRQQEIPGYGTPGANSNRLPFDPHGPGGSNQAQSTNCPVCGAHGSLRRQGDHYSCVRCGYAENVGAGSAVDPTGGASNATTSPTTLKAFDQDQGSRRVFTSLQPRDWRQGSAIAQRARNVLDSEETQ